MKKLEDQWERRLENLQLTKGGFTPELRQRISNAVNNKSRKRQKTFRWGIVSSGVAIIAIVATLLTPIHFSHLSFGTQNGVSQNSIYTTPDTTNTITSNPKNSSTYTDNADLIIADDPENAIKALKRVIQVANFKVYVPTQMFQVNSVLLNRKANDLRLGSGAGQNSYTIMEFPDRPGYDLSHVDPSYNPKIVTINGQNWTYMQLPTDSKSNEFAIYMNGTNITINSMLPYDQLVKIAGSIEMAN